MQTTKSTLPGYSHWAIHYLIDLNAWEIISTENVNIDPYDQLNLLVKISYWNLTQTLEYTTQQTKFFITCGLCPDPQVIEGMYETKNNVLISSQVSKNRIIVNSIDFKSTFK